MIRNNGTPGRGIGHREWVGKSQQCYWVPEPSPKSQAEKYFRYNRRGDHIRQTGRRSANFPSVSVDVFHSAVEYKIMDKCINVKLWDVTCQGSGGGGVTELPVPTLLLCRISIIKLILWLWINLCCLEPDVECFKFS